MRNFTEEARALAERLEAAGLSDSATALRDAIDLASTGSELLFGLRFHLHQLAAQKTVPDSLKATANELAAAIDAALKA